MDQTTIKNVIEAALFAAGRPMSINEMLRLFSEEERPERKALREVLDILSEEYADRGIALIEVASGYRIQVRQSMSQWLGRLSERKPPRYSRASMETLALIAYRQPITRGDIEEVRGVSVSSNIIRALLERGWIRIVGHRDVPGRPAMFGTTKEFLDYFNLKTLDELPSLAELQDIDNVNAELDFGDAAEFAPQDDQAVFEGETDDSAESGSIDVDDDDADAHHEGLIEETAKETDGELSDDEEFDDDREFDEDPGAEEYGAEDSSVEEKVVEEDRIEKNRVEKNRVEATGVEVGDDTDAGDDSGDETAAFIDDELGADDDDDFEGWDVDEDGEADDPAATVVTKPVSA